MRAIAFLVVSLFCINSKAASKTDCEFIYKALLPDVAFLSGSVWATAMEQAGLTEAQRNATVDAAKKIIHTGLLPLTESGKKVIADLQHLGCE
jgi:hypothetical protein